MRNERLHVKSSSLSRDESQCASTGSQRCTLLLCISRYPHEYQIVIEPRFGRCSLCVSPVLTGIIRVSSGIVSGCAGRVCGVSTGSRPRAFFFLATQSLF
jgi:hypothetical protein